MVTGAFLAKARHFCKCLVGETRRNVILINCLLATLVFVKVAIHNYGCDYISPDAIPVDINSSSVSQFLVEESDFCQRNPNLTFIVYIHSSLDRVEKRQDTRLTWASAGLYDPSVRMAAVFMVGKTKNAQEEIILREESQRYHDIVQGNYTDTYHMLSYKGLSSLNWVTRHCSHVPWTIHADDDVLIDVFLLKKFLLGKNGTQRELFCYPWNHSEVRRYGKWCVRQSEYSKSSYPTYCAGGAWMAATSLMHRLLDASLQVPIMWVDDVYLTGLLSRNASIPISSSLKSSFRKIGIDKQDFGKIMVWFEPKQPRTTWWYSLLRFHKYVPEENA